MRQTYIVVEETISAQNGKKGTILRNKVPET